MFEQTQQLDEKPDVTLTVTDGEFSLTYSHNAAFNSYAFVESLKADGIELEDTEWYMCG